MIRLIGLFVVAPLLAVVIITALMAFGVSPHLVFLPGFFLKSQFHVPNMIGVLATVFVWWLIVVAVWTAVHLVLTSKGNESHPAGPAVDDAEDRRRI